MFFTTKSMVVDFPCRIFYYLFFLSQGQWRSIFLCQFFFFQQKINFLTTDFDFTCSCCLFFDKKNQWMSIFQPLGQRFSYHKIIVSLYEYNNYSTKKTILVSYFIQIEVWETRKRSVLVLNRSCTLWLFTEYTPKTNNEKYMYTTMNMIQLCSLIISYN